MKIGISTSSLFARKNCEEALEFLSEKGVQAAEVFLESFCDYNLEFGNLLKSVNKNTDVHSFHVLTTQFEPQLYSVGERAREDSFKILELALKAGSTAGAKYYSFHGPARLKKTPITLNYERLGEITNRVISVCDKYGVTLAYENVHWAYYNFIGYFSELKKFCPKLKGTLDVKQARQSGISALEFISEMKEDIVTVHLSDVNEFGRMCLPGKGITDFENLFRRLKDVSFNGALILEVYPSDFKEISELLQSYEYIKNLSERIF